MSASPVEQLPILVIGSGISGLVLGIALRQLGFDVALFDKVQQLHAAGSGSRPILSQKKKHLTI
jgi:2-polyprenyl-6-methoxyphenol hydroxylase-like FAD-dependent oxidoreductase